MTYISATAMSWLNHNQISFDELIRATDPGQTTMGLLMGGSSRLHFYRRHELKTPGTLVRNRRRLLFNQIIEEHWYHELESGHGRLVISHCELPETVCVTLMNMKPELETVVELPATCMVRDTGARIVRAQNCGNGDLELLLRVKWHRISIAQRACKPVT